ncbi:hypothetical protein [Mucilaginibacter defluvii]|uniref:Uncharacterized protein n=1 Tax=Mucilaginibacter defluvii TaxID=1196019 RepID=A0ABP9FM62_9SPHI
MNLIKILRWSLGIPFALALTVSLLYLLIQVTGATEFSHKIKTNGDVVIGCFLYFIAPYISFTLLPIITCLIVPKPKKWGVTAVTIVSAIFSIYAVTYLLKSYNYLGISSNIGLSAGLGTGILISYNYFKNKGWNKAAKIETIEEY